MDTYLKYYSEAKPKNEGGENMKKNVYTGIQPNQVCPPLPDNKPCHFSVDSQDKVTVLKENLYMNPELFYYEEGDEDITTCFGWSRHNPGYRRYAQRQEYLTGTYGNRRYGYRHQMPHIVRFPSLEWFAWLRREHGCAKWAPAHNVFNVPSAHTPNRWSFANQGRVACSKPIINPSPSYTWEYFFTNCLFYIFEFIKNDTLLSVYFDTRLYMQEVGCIRYIVNCVMGNQSPVRDYIDKPWQFELVRFIQSHNIYSLYTGMNQNQLFMFKAAPINAFLVLSHDLTLMDLQSKKQHPNSTQHISNQYPKLVNHLERPFTRKYNRLVSAITDLFLGFVVNPYFTEFRLMGNFQPIQTDAITTFLAIFLKNTSTYGDMYKEQENKMAEALAKDKHAYKIIDNCNENCLIKKMMRV